MKPVTSSVLASVMDAMNIKDVSSATIRQIVALSEKLEQHLAEPFVHLEMGNPGLPACEAGIEIEREALLKGIANKYPNVAGIPELKSAGEAFFKAFLDVDIPARCIVPTVGSMQATFTLFLLMGQRIPGRDTILFLDPGFPAQHHQVKLLGLKQESLDIYDCRGEAMEQRLDEILSSGKITAIVYSNPNNPAWTNLTPVEFEILARMAEKHDVIIIEDLAYLGMDFRKHFGTPYKAPFVPTVAKYTDRCILLVSGSKIFSYAGQRIAIVGMSPAVADRVYPFYQEFYGMPKMWDAYVYGVLYCASSGTSHSPQYALAGMMRAAVEGRLDFVEQTRDYGRRAARAKEAFLSNGFHLVYAIDGDEPISDGFFFTAGYGDMHGDELQKELLRYGVSTISLPSTGSKQEGLRICVSMLTDEDSFVRLTERLKQFNNDHPLK